MLENLEHLESQFKDFLNKTIIGASKDYYKEQMKYQLKELQIIDNEDYEEYLKPYISQEDEGYSRALNGFGNNYVLLNRCLLLKGQRFLYALMKDIQQVK